MHSEEPVVDLGTQKVIVWERELNPNKKSLSAANEQEKRRIQYVEYAEPLMIDRHHPLMELF
jgi:hypothetical protein